MNCRASSFERVTSSVLCLAFSLRGHLILMIHDEQFAKKKDGGAATDGVSRAAFNKICLEYFEEGMRKPARNGNPGSLESGLAQQRRHFLRGRWRDPAVPHDLTALKGLWETMTPEQVAASQDLLEDFSRWKPGPAGRGGERLCRKRGSEDTGSEGELDSSDNNQAPFPAAGLVYDSTAPRGEPMGQHYPEVGCPPHKRVAACDMAGRRDFPPHHGRVDGSGPLELLCNVAFNSDQIPSHPLGPDHLAMMDTHSLQHDATVAADRIGKGEMGHAWHANHLESTDLGPTNALGEDEGSLSDDQPPPALHHHRYPPHHMHDHLSAHPMHRMSSSMGMDYGHGHPRMHGRMSGYGVPHDDPFMGEVSRREMLPPPSHRPPVPSLENAWDSPSARPYPAPSRMTGVHASTSTYGYHAQIAAARASATSAQVSPARTNGKSIAAPWPNAALATPRPNAASGQVTQACAYRRASKRNAW